MREIKIGDQAFEIHYGQNAICALEDELDSSIYSIVQRIHNNTLGLRDIRAIIWSGMLANNRAITPEAVGIMMDKSGANPYRVALGCAGELMDSFRKMIGNEDEAEDGEPEKNE